MDFEISPEQRELKAAVRAFAREELNHDLEKRDHEGCFPRECWQ
jgi:alkylation response protein AidB-like acyl-CoA dehydrogenase